MQIARHWIREEASAQDRKGRKHLGMAWGWSATSDEEARQRARVSAQRVADWLAAGGSYQGEPPRSCQYQYGLDRPPREEIIQELRDAAGEVTALITRNAYGALVLNTRDLMFVDVDLGNSQVQPKSVGFFASLFGKKPAPQPPPARDGVLDRLRAWCTSHREYGVRLYQTAAGYRAAITDRPMHADSDESRSILDGMGSDPLYCRLCDVQKCYRARLTPKCWRMGVSHPLGRFPFPDASLEQQYRDWQRAYDEKAPNYATCRLMESHGPDVIHPALANLVALHDSMCGVDRDAPLA
jgi:hypothetical protein